ncbi:MAG TPA: HDOD domain-containing protein, partial [Smithellaceae bacterium]|nr:HDOD domain-containing protein [Smithellaceae bacterium]
MVLLIVILAALACIFVLIFAAKAVKGEKSRLPAAASVPTVKQKHLQAATTTTVSSHGTSVSSVLHKEIRQYLINGVSLIFDEKAPATDKSLIPRTLEQIDAQVLETVSGHLAGMDQFRIRQARLEKYLNDPTVQMADLSKGITSDPLMTAKVLKMVNSSYFGMTQKVDSISHALMILGMQNIKNIAYREGMRGLFETGTMKDKAASLWKHANLVSVCTQHFFDLFAGLNRGTLFTLGIVHDIGKLVLAETSRHLPGGREGEYTIDLLITEEDQLFGINHALIGGCALERWNFSELMIMVVNNHHLPSYTDLDHAGLDPEILRYVLALFLSDQMAR